MNKNKGESQGSRRKAKGITIIIDQLRSFWLKRAHLNTGNNPKRKCGRGFGRKAQSFILLPGLRAAGQTGGNGESWKEQGNKPHSWPWPSCGPHVSGRKETAPSLRDGSVANCSKTLQLGFLQGQSLEMQSRGAHGNDICVDVCHGGDML